MQFSLKWMLSVVAYAAVFMSSMQFASPAWALALGTVSFLLVVGCVVGLFSRRVRIRWQCLGVLVFGCGSASILMQNDHSPLNWFYPASQMGRLAGDSITDALVQLNTMHESKTNRRNAQESLRRAAQGADMAAWIFRSPSSSFRWDERQRVLWVVYATGVFKLHLVLLLSLLGGLVGLWFHRRETHFEANRKCSPS